MSDLAKRAIYTCADGMANPSFTRDLQEYAPAAVWAVIGPLENHMADPEFQDELALLCMRYNLSNGTLSEEKFAELSNRKPRDKVARATISASHGAPVEQG